MHDGCMVSLEFVLRRTRPLKFKFYVKFGYVFTS